MARRKCSRRVTANLNKFINLVDTPSVYQDQAGKYLVVNETEDGVKFVDVGSLNYDFLSDQTVYSCAASTDLRDAVYLVTDGVAATADKADAANLPVIGLVVAKPSTTSCIIQTLGYLDGFTGLDVGETYFLDADGKISNTPTTVAGEALYVIGVAKSSTRLELRIGSSYVIKA